MCTSEPRHGASAGALILLLALGCSVDRARYEAQLYHCDVAAQDEDACGDGYGCYGSSRHLGARDHCAPSCVISDADTLCTPSGHRIATCDPAAPACAEGFSCMRTDLVADEGVCLPAQTCSSSDDCRDPVRGTCIGTELKATYPRATALKTDRLFCAQGECRLRDNQCAPGTTCLGQKLGGLPDVCLPDCRSEAACPPGFLCSREVFQRSLPATCVPGLLGFRCTGAVGGVECLVGECSQAAAPNDRNLCTVPCQAEADCSQYDAPGVTTDRMLFTCAGGTCVSPMSYLLQACAEDSECVPPQRCSGALRVEGRTLRVCAPECIGGDAGARCPARGGIPNACHAPAPDGGIADGGTGACVPALFGLPCAQDGACAGDLECLDGTCLLRCTSAVDCRRSRWVDEAANCSPEGRCLPGCEGASCSR